jgi:hypothetical protein
MGGDCGETQWGSGKQETFTNHHQGKELVKQVVDGSPIGPTHFESFVSVSSSTGFAPDVILFGNNVDLNRGIIIHSKVASERFIECPKYKVQD